MAGFVVSIPPGFDWDSEEGEYMNLMLNTSGGGLTEEHLSEDEKALVARMKEKYTQANASP